MKSINQLQGIRNIIFDLGGVILNIDYKKTETAFINLGVTDFPRLYTQFHASTLFTDLETGKITAEAFINELKNSSPTPLSNAAIISAWNAMLLDFPAGRLKFLYGLKDKYRTFLLSNTNIIHYTAIHENYTDVMSAEKTLDSCFEKTYYSHDLGMRKPDKEIYEFVLSENHLAREETVFIDDTLANVEGANRVGIRGIYLQPGTSVEMLFQ